MWSLRNEFITKNNQTRLYSSDTPIVGITGGVASGKSTLSSYLRKKGFAIIDADEKVKEIYKTDQMTQLIGNLNPELLSNGEINFKKLREHFFNNQSLKQKLETEIYRQLPDKVLESLKSFPGHQVVLYDVPLLFEKKLEVKMDQVILIYADLETQKKRLELRDNTSKEVVEKILASQLSLEEKITKTKWKINNTEVKIDFEIWPEVDHLINTLFINI